MADPQVRSPCWCGNEDLVPFSPGYLRCAECETLISTRACLAGGEPSPYWDYYVKRLVEGRGYPTLKERTRTDLSERCLHWLRTALKYAPPPGRALELGSAHGGFVALLRWAGYDATGLELTSELAEYARKTFEIPVLTGPVEGQVIPCESVRLLAMMDVIEHLADPGATLRHCLNLIEPGGILLLQSPRYKEGSSLEQMRAASDPFLMHLEPEQHLFLFSESAMRKFLERLGFLYVEFQPAIFAHYDLFLVAGRRPLVTHAASQIDEVLARSPQARMVQALLDTDDRVRGVVRQLMESEADRAARLRVIEEQGRRLGEVEGECNRLNGELSELRQHWAFSEADRAARLRVIEEQGRRLGEVERERTQLQSERAELQHRLQAASRVIQRVRLTLVYRLLRKLGLWGWLEGEPAGASPGSDSLSEQGLR